MKKQLFIVAIALQLCAQAQSPVIYSWTMNTTGKYASYWENISTGGPPTYTFHPTTDSADVLQVCYTADSVWVRANGMTDNMGKYLNPGGCSSQNYVYRFPRTPTVPTSKTVSPKVGAIGMLTNGIPIYGLSNSYSWNGSTNTNMGGQGIWNVEVYLSEGFVLDTAFGAHPQQAGAYHSHATPWRLYESYSATVHSPLVGYAFDGYPVYGPYGYSTPTDSSSAITLMKTGYSLRNITQRHTLPYGVSLSASQYGPNVSTTYPLGTYCEDYEWLSTNGGDLDKYNGRYCVTPEYPGGTYAYFITMNSSKTPQFPYYIGIEYYGQPVTDDLVALGATSTSITIPSSGTSCVTTGIKNAYSRKFVLYPNPANNFFSIKNDESFAGNNFKIKITDELGRTVYNTVIVSNDQQIFPGNDLKPGIYFVQLLNEKNVVESVQKLILQ